MSALTPKRTKYRKMQKGNNRGTAYRGSDCSFGDFAMQALAAHRATGHRLGEAEALFVLGGVADHSGDPDRAQVLRRDAATLLTAIGAEDPGTAHSPGRGLGWTSAGSVPRQLGE